MVEGGGKLGEPIKPLCPGTWCQLDFEELHTCQNPGIPNTKREGALCVYYDWCFPCVIAQTPGCPLSEFLIRDRSEHILTALGGCP